MAIRYLGVIRQRVSDMYSFQENLVTDLQFFNINQPEDSNLKKLDKDLKILEDIWELVKDWEDSWNEWRSGSFWDINIDEMEDKAVSLYRQLNRLCKQYKDRNWEILETKRKVVDEFRRTLPLILALKNTAMRDRHWNKVRGLMNV